MAEDRPVQSRLKRFETVVEKLRHRTRDLSRFEDIAGCRVVLPTMIEQHEVLRHIRERWEVTRERDYQASPHDGYRAWHIVVRAQDRPVEVQVRTELEDQWANASEALAGLLDPAIKWGQGPPEVRGMLDALSRLVGGLDEREATRRALVTAGLTGLADRVAVLPKWAEQVRDVLASLAGLKDDVNSDRAASTPDDEMLGTDAFADSEANDQ